MPVPSMKRSLLAAGFVLVLPALGQAQGRGMVAPPRPAVISPAVAHPGPVVASHITAIRTGVVTGVRPSAPVRVGTLTRIRTASGTVRIVRRVAPSTVRVVRRDAFDLDNDDVDAVPGLGFDFVHFAATHPNAFKHHRVNLGGFFPFFSGGFVMPSIPAVVDEAAPVEEVEEVAEAAPKRVRVVRQEPQPVVSPAPETGPMRPSEEYVFVRRDGTLFFAVAYSWEDGALRYITSQGLRGSMAREALDLNATQQFNEQRGLSFRSPA